MTRDVLTAAKEGARRARSFAKENGGISDARAHSIVSEHTHQALSDSGDWSRNRTKLADKASDRYKEHLVRNYGSGHDMTHHGEGKSYGDK